MIRMADNCWVHQTQNEYLAHKEHTSRSLIKIFQSKYKNNLKYRKTGKDKVVDDKKENTEFSWPWLQIKKKYIWVYVLLMIVECH